MPAKLFAVKALKNIFFLDGRYTFCGNFTYYAHCSWGRVSCVSSFLKEVIYNGSRGVRILVRLAADEWISCS
jgi:hypothetical protein